jgi:hypothetical protein
MATGHEQGRVWAAPSWLSPLVAQAREHKIIYDYDTGHNLIYSNIFKLE